MCREQSFELRPASIVMVPEIVHHLFMCSQQLLSSTQNHVQENQGLVKK